MKTRPRVVVRNDRVAPLRAGHPWVFSGACRKNPDAAPGSVVEVVDEGGGFVGLGTYQPGNSIRVRMFSSDPTDDFDQSYFERRLAALRAWKPGLLPAETTGYRLAHADADGLPGIVVDVYGRAVVLQLHTAGAELQRGALISAIRSVARPELIVERSDIPIRLQEGLSPLAAVVHEGTCNGPVRFAERGLTFAADLLRGQKTGFFLDQREARAGVRRAAAGKRVVNLFSYSCAFGVAAARGGAASTVNVDTSMEALDLGRLNYEANGLEAGPGGSHRFVKGDVFDYLEGGGAAGAELLVCDPPAFAKSKDRIEEARRAYVRLNRLCFTALETGSVLVTSSCSGAVGLDDFQGLLRLAAGQAGRRVVVLETILQPADHTQHLAFPEGRYLKTLVLQVVG